MLRAGPLPVRHVKGSSMRKLVAGSAAAVFLAACGSAASRPEAVRNSTGQASDQRVSITNFVYTPAEIFVKVGTTITFLNLDDSVHTATAKGTFDTGNLTKGMSGTFTPTTAGRIDYICDIHQYMKGAVVVE
jgi:plastocyanin